MEKNIIIRKTTLDDIEQTVKLGNLVWRNSYASILPKRIFDEIDARVEKKIKQLKEIGVNINGRIDYVALDGDKIIAYITGNIKSGYEQFKDYADLMAIYINPDYQHFGLGKKLFDIVVSFFKENNCKKMVIGVLKENIQARKAYEKWGGKLDSYEFTFTISGFTTTEVFYIFDLF